MGDRPRIRGVDEFLTEVETNGTVREAHPEVAFAALNGDQAIGSTKTEHNGVAARVAVLDRHFDGAAETYHPLVTQHIDGVPTWQRRIGMGNRDDLVDAFALAVSARCAGSALATLPAEPPTDAEGQPKGASREEIRRLNSGKTSGLATSAVPERRPRGQVRP